MQCLVVRWSFVYRAIILTDFGEFSSGDEINNSRSMMYRSHIRSRNLRLVFPDFATA